MFVTIAFGSRGFSLAKEQPLRKHKKYIKVFNSYPLHITQQKTWRSRSWRCAWWKARFVDWWQSVEISNRKSHRRRWKDRKFQAKDSCLSALCFALQWEVIQRAKCWAHCQLQDLQGLFHEYELKRLLQLCDTISHHQHKASGMEYGAPSGKTPTAYASVLSWNSSANSTQPFKGH